MRIGIDARIFKYQAYKGIAQTIYNIIDDWKLYSNYNEYYLISNVPIELPKTFPRNWHLIQKGKIKNGPLWIEFELAEILKELRIEVYWGTNFLLPQKVNGCKYVVTVHDLGLLRYPKTASITTYIILKLLGKKSCKRANKVLAVSKATAKDIIDFYGIPEEKIAICYNGINEKEYRYGSDQKPNLKQLREYNIHYFLFLSTIEPRKNPETILKAFRIFNKKYPNIYLVFTGERGWRTHNFDKILDGCQCNDRIIFTGYVNDAQKRWLLRHAIALLYPSLYEGFGLPILEAMAEDLPVITSNASAMPEVAGNAGIYIQNPYDEEEIYLSMCRVVLMSPLERARLIRTMRRQVSQFSWEKCANQVLFQLIKVCEEN